MRRGLILTALLAAFVWPAPAQAARPAVCLLPILDARPVTSPASIPYRVKAENAPEPIRAHPPEGPGAVRRLVLRALAADGSVEVVDMAGADPKRISSDPGVGRCALIVGGAVFHYEGTVAVDIYGSKIFSGLVGYELVATDPRSGRHLLAPVVFAGRRQSEPVKPDEEFGTSDRQTFGEWIGEALKAASASLPARLARPVGQAAHRSARSQSR